MANVLSQFGLMSQGIDAAKMEQERIRNARQYNDLDPQRRTAFDQQSQLVGQQIETGKMGLEDTRRNREADAATRASASAARAAGKTMSGSLLEMADTEAKSGRMDRALQYRQAHKSLEEFGAKELVHTALTDPRPGERPDLVQIMNQNERTKGVVSAVLDGNGILTVVRQGNQPAKINVGVTAEMLGLVQAPKIHNVPAGGVGVMTQPGRPTQTIETPKTFPEPAPHVLKSYNAEGQPVGERLVDRSGKEIATSGVAAETGPNSQKQLPVIKEMADELMTRKDMFRTEPDPNPNNPLGTLKVRTDLGSKVLNDASIIWQANPRGINHIQALDIAEQGGRAGKTLVQNSVTGELAWQKDKAIEPIKGTRKAQGAAMPIQNASAQAAAPVPVSAPAIAPAAPPPQPPQPPQPPKAPPPQPSVASVASGTKAPSSRQYDIALENSDPELKRIGATLRLGVKNSQLDFQLWQAYVARARQLGSKGFARGGKVKKQQRYGLG